MKVRVKAFNGWGEGIELRWVLSISGITGHLIESESESVQGDAVNRWSWGVYFWSLWQSHWIAEAVTTDAPVTVQTYDAPILKSGITCTWRMLWPQLLLWFKPMLLFLHSTNPLKPYEIWHCTWTLLSQCFHHSASVPEQVLLKPKIWCCIWNIYLTIFPVAVQTFVLLFHVHHNSSGKYLNPWSEEARMKTSPSLGLAR